MDGRGGREIFGGVTPLPLGSPARGSTHARTHGAARKSSVLPNLVVGTGEVTYLGYQS